MRFVGPVYCLRMPKTDKKKKKKKVEKSTIAGYCSHEQYPLSLIECAAAGEKKKKKKKR